MTMGIVEAAVQAERERIIKLLKSNLKLAKFNAGFSMDMARTENYLHGLEESIALIKGENK